MSIDIRLPNITSGTPAQQLSELQNYVYQLVEQLNWALNTVSTSTESGTKNIIMSQSATKEEAKKTFESIKDLIIKSADILTVYSESIQKTLKGIYVAESEFGTYKKETQTTIDANSSGVALLTNLIESVNEQLSEINGWINLGLLEDGQYGIEVGQRFESSFRKYARFLADGIYFYLPSVNEPVAKLTNKQLVVYNIVVSESAQFGRYYVDLSHGMKFKWR